MLGTNIADFNLAVSSDDESSLAIERNEIFCSGDFEAIISTDQLLLKFNQAVNPSVIHALTRWIKMYIDWFGNLSSDDCNAEILKEYYILCKIISIPENHSILQEITQSIVKKVSINPCYAPMVALLFDAFCTVSTNSLQSSCDHMEKNLMDMYSVLSSIVSDESRLTLSSNLPLVKAIHGLLIYLLVVQNKNISSDLGQLLQQFPRYMEKLRSTSAQYQLEYFCPVAENTLDCLLKIDAEIFRSKEMNYVKILYMMHGYSTLAYEYSDEKSIRHSLQILQDGFFKKKGPKNWCQELEAVTFARLNALLDHKECDIFEKTVKKATKALFPRKSSSSLSLSRTKSKLSLSDDHKKNMMIGIVFELSEYILHTTHKESCIGCLNRLIDFFRNTAWTDNDAVCNTMNENVKRLHSSERNRVTILDTLIENEDALIPIFGFNWKNQLGFAEDSSPQPARSGQIFNQVKKLKDDLVDQDDFVIAPIDANIARSELRQSYSSNKFSVFYPPLLDKQMSLESAEYNLLQLKPVNGSNCEDIRLDIHGHSTQSKVTQVPESKLFSNDSIYFGGRSERKILILGNPGSGKTVLSRKLVFLWASRKCLTQFNAVYLLPRNVLASKRYAGSRWDDKTLANLIADACFPGITVRALRKKFKLQILDELKLPTTLVIVDDFISSQSPVVQYIESNHEWKHALIVLRCTAPIDWMKKFDKVLFNSPPREDQALAFAKLCVNDQEKRNHLRSFLLSSSIVSNASLSAVDLSVVCAAVNGGEIESAKLADFRCSATFQWQLCNVIWNKCTLASGHQASIRYLSGRTEKEEFFSIFGQIALTCYQNDEFFLTVNSVRELFDRIGVSRDKEYMLWDSGFMVQVEHLCYFRCLTFQEYFVAYELCRLFSNSSDESGTRVFQRFVAEKIRSNDSENLFLLVFGELSRVSADPSKAAAMLNEVKAVLSKDEVSGEKDLTSKINKQFVFLRYVHEANSENCLALEVENCSLKDLNDTLRCMSAFSLLGYFDQILSVSNILRLHTVTQEMIVKRLSELIQHEPNVEHHIGCIVRLLFYEGLLVSFFDGSGEREEAGQSMSSLLNEAEHKHFSDARIMRSQLYVELASSISAAKSVLMIKAAGDGDYDVVRDLLASGAFVDSTNSKGETAVMLSAMGGHLKVAQLLVERGASLDHISEEDYTPIYFSALSGSVRIFSYFVAKGADVNHPQGPYEESLLFPAVRADAVEIIQFLLDNGSDVNALDRNRDTPLTVAITLGHHKSCSLLLANGANCNLEKNNITDLLLSAAKYGLIDAMDFLLYLTHVNINEQFEDGKTLLMYSAENGKKELCCFLIDRGADAMLRSNQSWSLLTFAARGGSREVIEVFLNMGFNIELKDEHSWTPLMHAAYSSRLKGCQYLIDRGARVDAVSDCGETVLICAAKGGSPDVLKFLLRIGFEVDGKDNYGRTPLMHAAVEKHHSACEFLIDCGADVDAKCLFERNAFMYAADGGSVEVLSIFLERGVDIESRDKNMRTPLMFTALEGHAKACKFLISRGSNIGTVCSFSWTPLVYAIKSKSIDTFNVLLSAGCDIETVDTNGKTPLMHAAAVGSHDMCHFLIMNGARFNVTANNGETLLMFAAKGGSVDAMALFIENGLDLNAIDVDGRNALMYAAYCAKLDACRFLLKYGVDINSTSKHGETPFMYAARGGATVVLDFLLRHGSSIDDQDIDGYTALIHAIKEKKEEACRFLVKVGANCNLASFDDKTPFVHAVEGMSQKIKELFIEVFSAAATQGSSSEVPSETIQMMNGRSNSSYDFSSATEAIYAANSSFRNISHGTMNQSSSASTVDEHGRTQLMHAAFEGNLELCNTLICNYADIHAKCAYQCTPLIYAVRGGSIEIVMMLIENGADIEAKDENGWTPLMHAVADGRIQICDYLINVLADINAAADDGLTPFMCAASCGSIDILNLLLKKGAYIFEKDYHERTPLMFAASEGNYEACKYLIELGMNSDLVSANGQTHLMYAASGGSIKVLELFLRMSASMEERDLLGRTPLMYAASAGKFDACTYLLLHGAEVSAMCSRRRTVLMYGVISGSIDIIRLLLEHNMPVEAQDKEGWTALMFAVEEGRLEVCRFLLENGAVAERKNFCSETPLIIASRHRSVEMLDLLLKGGADIEARDSLSRTPLMHAAMKSQAAVCSYLIKHNADVNATSTDGQTALMCASRCGSLPVVTLLLQHGADRSAKDEHGWTALMHAARKLALDVCEYLLRSQEKVGIDHKLESDYFGKSTAGGIDSAAT